MKDFINQQYLDKKNTKMRRIFQTFRMPSDKDPKDENGWSKTEDDIILEITKYSKKSIWKYCGKILIDKTPRECKRRYDYLIKKYRKGRWTKEEDEIMLALYEKFGKNWVLFSKIMKSRKPKQIRIRFLDFIDPKLIKTPFTREEDEKLIKVYKQDNCNWRLIRENFPLRPFNSLKRRLKKLIPGFKITSCMKFCRKTKLNKKNFISNGNSLYDNDYSTKPNNTITNQINYSSCCSNTSNTDTTLKKNSEADYINDINNVFENLKYDNKYFFFRTMQNEFICSEDS